MFVLQFSLDRFRYPQGATSPSFSNWRSQSGSPSLFGTDRFSNPQGVANNGTNNSSGYPLSTGDVFNSSPGSSYYNQFSGPFGGNQFPFGGNQINPFSFLGNQGQFGQGQFGQGQFGQGQFGQGQFGQGQFGQGQFGQGQFGQGQGQFNQLAQLKAQSIGNLFAIPDSESLPPLYRFMLANGILNPPLVASIDPRAVGRLAQLTGLSSLPPQQNAQGSGNQSNGTQQSSSNPSPFPNGIPPVYSHSYNTNQNPSTEVLLGLHTRDGRTAMYRQTSTQVLADRIVLRFTFVGSS
jgi:hypothetical protein